MGSASRLAQRDTIGQPLGGEVSNTLNLELRQPLTDALWGGLFADAGNVSLSADDWFGDFRSGYGVGLRYLLPVGALRLNWAYNPTARGDEGQSVLHLSVGMAFQPAFARQRSRICCVDWKLEPIRLRAYPRDD